MKFQAAFNQMKLGTPIKLPEWGGFWAWDDQQKTINIHLREGDVIDIRRSHNMDYTISHMFRDDWQEAENTTEHHQNSTENAQRIVDSAIKNASPGEKINLESLAKEFGGFRFESLVLAAQNRWASGALDHGESKREYVVL